MRGYRRPWRFIALLAPLAGWSRGAATIGSEGEERFLGTQCYIGDTQADTALASVSAVCALAGLSRIDDGSLAKVLAGRGGIGQSQPFP